MALLPINKIEKIAEKRIDVRQLDVYENTISGDAIDGGKITNFSSSGIDDKSDTVQVVINNDRVEVQKDLTVKGTITVENLKYEEAQVPKLNVTEAVMIDHNEVLWKDRLGRSVKKSNLEQVGNLKDLRVKNTLYAAESRVGINTDAPSADFSVNVNGYEVITKMQDNNAYVGTHAPVPFAIGTDDTPRIICRSNGDVTIGNEDIKFCDKVFSSGYVAPTEGRWDIGSIVWNSKPAMNQAVGWVCIKGGTPGTWKTFGLVY